MKWNLNTIGKLVGIGAGGYVGITYVMPAIQALPLLNYEIGQLKVAGVVASTIGVIGINYLYEFLNI